MRERAGRLQRYLRVAYEAGAQDDGGAPVVRVRSRWAVGPAVAVRAGAVLLLLAVVAATVLALARHDAGAAAAPSAPVALPAVTPSAGPPAPAAPAGAETTSAPMLIVHVAGAVASPGIVELAPGTRVAGAIGAAGGATDDADLDALNLAAPVTDGQQVYVPVEGELPGGGAPGGEPGQSAGALVDINTADAAALDSLPGVGPAIAERIIAWRAEHGPFSSVDGLLDVSGIGPATLDRLWDRVTV